METDIGFDALKDMTIAEVLKIEQEILNGN